MTKTGATATSGITDNNGDKNKKGKNKNAETKEQKPVLPPS